MLKIIAHCPRRLTGFILTAILLISLSGAVSRAAVPPAEKLLPPDTLFIVSAPDWTKLQETFKKSPQTQLWNDPAMKPFRDKFGTKWEEEFVRPLERDLGVKFDDYSALLQGQVTLALTQEQWTGKDKEDGEPAVVLLIDTKDKSDLLKKNLAALRKQWSDAGRAMRTEKIRDLEFLVLPLSSNDVPKTLQEFFPQHQEVEELGKDSKSSSKNELVIGQHESLLILGSTVKVVEKVVIRLTGSSAPTLADEASFEANRVGLFREAPLFGWVNSKSIIDILTRTFSQKENPDAPNPLPLPPMGKIIAASGLGGIKSMAFSYRDSGDGATAEVFLTAPESTRAGLTRLLAMEPKDATPPAFVPAEVAHFQRSRLDGRKAIATIEKMLGEISAEALNTWNFLLSNGSEAIKQTDPDFDIRKNLFGNLGDDFVTYEKVAKTGAAGEILPAPSILLIGSPNPDQLAAAVRGLFVIASSEGGTPKSREFLGKKIYSIKLAGLPMVGGAGGALNYAASGGYVAFSTDDSLLEEFLRSGESQVKPLRDKAGITEAAAKIGGQSTGWLNYENDAETVRLMFDTLRQSASASGPAAPSVLASVIPFAAPEKKFKDWFDLALLPSYDKVAKYFGFSVWSGAASVDGITFRFYSPTPAELKK